MLVPGLVVLLFLALAALGLVWRARRRTHALPASLTAEDGMASAVRPPASAPADLEADPWTD